MKSKSLRPLIHPVNQPLTVDEAAVACALGLICSTGRRGLCSVARAVNTLDHQGRCSRIDDILSALDASHEPRIP